MFISSRGYWPIAVCSNSLSPCLPVSLSCASLSHSLTLSLSHSLTLSLSHSLTLSLSHGGSTHAGLLSVVCCLLCLGRVHTVHTVALWITGPGLSGSVRVAAD